MMMTLLPIEDDDMLRVLEQDKGNEGRSKRHSIPTLIFIVIPMVIFLAFTVVAAVFMPPSPILPTENDSTPSSVSNDHQNNNSESENGNNIVTNPTLLSMRDNNEGGDLLNVHHHQLYTQIKDASTFHYHDKNANYLATIANHGAKTLASNKYEVEYGDSLTLAWSPCEGNDVDDEDIIAIYCPSFEVDPKKFRDVATLAQVKATHAIHAKKSVGEMEDNVWYIPSFPVVREDSCEFRLYSHSVDDASNQGNEGNDADLEQEEKHKHHYTFMATTGPISLTSNTLDM